MPNNPEDDYDAPPSYIESTTSPNLSSSSSITTTLSSLTSLLRTTQAQQSALESHATTALLPLLTPHLTSLLTRLGTIPHPPAVAELVFVPAAAVGPGWSIASDADRRAGEVVQVIRVATDDPDAKGRGGAGGADGKAAAGAEHDDAFGYADDDVIGGKSSSAREFDDWGRWDDETSMTSAARGGERWWSWWDDEGLARRLARQLQPEPSSDRTVVRAVVEQAKEEKEASRWGLFRPPPSGASSSSSSHPPAQSSTSGPTHDQDVSITVRAEEVTFRKENEMGIWESTRGWGIVARVRIRR